MSADGLATVDFVDDITQQIHSISPGPIGYGGQSDIYTGLWRSVHGESKVAIKVIRAAPTVSSSGELPRALRREISVWKRISHPNIQDLCGVCAGFGPAPALVSPWYDNGDINEYVRKRAADPGIEVVKLELFAGVAAGLTFLHDHHIVHGDIKGGNVLMSNDGVPRLCDFGLSRLLIEHSFSTTTDTGRGTVRWMAPELLVEEGEGARHSRASDIWACGCLIIEVWSNVKPYHTKANDQQVILALSNRQQPHRPSDMPVMVWSIVEACCSFYPSLRPSPSYLLGCISTRLTMKRVYPMVTLNRPVDAAGLDLLNKMEAILRTAEPRQTSELYTLPDAELLTEVVRLLAVFSLEFVELSPRLEDPVFVWCLAKLGAGDLLLPPGVRLPPAHDDSFFIDFIAVHESAELRPLARLLERARPGLAKQFMTQFASPPPHRSFNIGTRLWSVAWFSDNHRIVVGCKDAKVRVVNIATGRILLRLAKHTKPVLHVAVSPDQRILASCSVDESVILWEVETGLAMGPPVIGHNDEVRYAAFSSDGRDIVSGARNATIRRVWRDVTFQKCVGIVYCVNFSPDGSRIVASSGNNVRVWDADTGLPIITLTGHRQRVRSVAYSPDALRIVSGSDDQTVRIWDAITGQMVGSPLRGHSGWVLCVAYSSDSTRIVSSSYDHTIRIWDAVTGTSLDTILEHTDVVRSIALSPDGTQLASASDDGTVHIWDDWRRYDRRYDI